MYIYTNKPSKVIFGLTKLLMTDEVTRIDGTFKPRDRGLYRVQALLCYPSKRFRLPYRTGLYSVLVIWPRLSCTQVGTIIRRRAPPPYELRYPLETINLSAEHGRDSNQGYATPLRRRSTVSVLQIWLYSFTDFAFYHKVSIYWVSRISF